MIPDPIADSTVFEQHFMYAYPTRVYVTSHFKQVEEKRKSIKVIAELALTEKLLSAFRQVG